MKPPQQVNPSEIIGNKMMELLDKPNGARLQAMVIAMACMGVYSPPFGKRISSDDLILITDFIEAAGRFPLRSLEDCVRAFDLALWAYDDSCKGGAE
jgi:hypothetical protein